MSRSLPVFQSLDELDDDEPGGKDRKEEEELVQANTFQNEAMIADPVTGHFMVSSHMTWKDWRDWRDLDFILKTLEFCSRHGVGLRLIQTEEVLIRSLCERRQR